VSERLFPAGSAEQVRDVLAIEEARQIYGRAGIFFEGQPVFVQRGRSRTAASKFRRVRPSPKDSAFLATSSGAPPNCSIGTKR
jgi:hypothetical protein